MIVMWFLGTFPAAPDGATGPAIDHSFAGMLGHALAPRLAPIGFTWQIAIALAPGMAAREVAVAAPGTVYALSETGASPRPSPGWPGPSCCGCGGAGADKPGCPVRHG